MNLTIIELIASVAQRRATLYNKYGMINSIRESSAFVMSPEKMLSTPETQEVNLFNASNENRIDKMKLSIIFSFTFLF